MISNLPLPLDTAANTEYAPSNIHVLRAIIVLPMYTSICDACSLLWCRALLHCALDHQPGVSQI